MRRRFLVAVATAAVVLAAAPAWACGGLIAPNGTINLLKTTTLAGYHDGIEHYVTGFEFVGAGAAFGSIIPLPDVPTKVRKAGWTLQRLVREVQPPVLAFSDSAGAATLARQERAVVIDEYRVAALDITILEGGGTAVGNWARENGFNLSPDAPEVLDFYGDRSPIFAAIRFDPGRAARQGVTEGDGTPVHFTIPTDDPWVPLRILALGKQSLEPVEADIFLLTDHEPGLMTFTQRSGVTLARSERASEELLFDLRTDKSMGWVPEGMWLSYLQLSTSAGNLLYDLAIDAEGSSPSWIDAGIRIPGLPSAEAIGWHTWAGIATILVALNAVAMVARRRATLA